jgi:hypothetical protein
VKLVRLAKMSFEVSYDLQILRVVNIMDPPRPPQARAASFSDGFIDRG